jgi:hypothetical protein
MRTNSDPESDDTLLDAVLRDEGWEAASAAFKTEALRTLRVRRCIRRLIRGAGSVAVLAAMVAAVAYWSGRPPATPRQITVANTAILKATAQPRYLTDAELVAAFPKGSCFIAEVDGKKELVFFDPKVERAYVARPGVRGN